MVHKTLDLCLSVDGPGSIQASKLNLDDLLCLSGEG